ncbi:MAG: hypothetical protein EBT34_00825, partial [Acetobacteraceae bacterium]|nr:hypothetical protein [Acetobacteraceae bacterium]
KGKSEISGYALFEDQRAELGYTAIMTPGTVAGFAYFHAQFCTMDWADLLAPAITMARDGMLVTPFFRDFLERKPQPGLPSGMQRVTKTKACAALYLNQAGQLHEVGEGWCMRKWHARWNALPPTARRISTRAKSPTRSSAISRKTAPLSPPMICAIIACAKARP